VPVAFPSHPGLIAPLWRRWPNAFSAGGCIVGAMVPDVVDGAIGVARGALGQGIGHSLLGLFALCIPVGLAIDLPARRLIRALAPSGALWRFLTRGIPRRDAPVRAGVEAWSIGVGAFSHLAFDFVSHGNFLWLYPWYDDPEFFPDFWYARWFEVPLPGYADPYPIGPHFLVWVLLSVAGAVLYFVRARGRG
jgi:hypothetical protein